MQREVHVVTRRMLAGGPGGIGRPTRKCRTLGARKAHRSFCCHNRSLVVGNN
jgi:hypothetical protein